MLGSPMMVFLFEPSYLTSFLSCSHWGYVGIELGCRLVLLPWDLPAPLGDEALLLGLLGCHLIVG